MGRSESNARGELQERVRMHWEREACGTRYGASATRRERLAEIEEARYRLEPYIPGFADFRRYAGRRVLEIGVGAGVDFSHWVAAGADASGIDLTATGVELTRERLELAGVGSDRYDLRQGDAENLPFPDGEFDLVYSWGVLHHTPDTERAFREAHRVLKPGGRFKGMIYHLRSWAAVSIWLLHGPLRARPWLPVRRAVFDHLESPGTKVYTLREAGELLRRAGFRDVELSTRLGPGDLLSGEPSREYRTGRLRWAWKLYPRWLVRLLGDRYGLYLLMEAVKR